MNANMPGRVRLSRRSDRSAARDWERWRLQYFSYGSWSYRNNMTEYEGEKDYLYEWLAQRDGWMRDYQP